MNFLRGHCHSSERNWRDTCIPPFGHQTDKMRAPKKLQFPQESHDGRNKTKQNCWSHQLEKERDSTQPSHRMRPPPQERLAQRQRRSVIGRTTLDHDCWVTHTFFFPGKLKDGLWVVAGAGRGEPTGPHPTLANVDTLKSKNKNKDLLFCILLLLICLTGLLSIDSWLSFVQ